MNRLHRRAYVLIAVPVLLAAVTLTSCTTPATGFHFVGVTPATSKVIAGELQLFPGSYTLAANATSNVSDLHWVITYGSAANPAATPVTTANGVATVAVTFSAPPDATKRYYRICLSSIAQPLQQTCQNVAVGGDTIWTGHWEMNPASFAVTQTSTTVALQLSFLAHPSVLFDASLTSPFLATANVQGVDGWFEWVSNTELRAFFPPILGTTDPVTFTRTA